MDGSIKPGARPARGGMSSLPRAGRRVAGELGSARVAASEEMPSVRHRVMATSSRSSERPKDRPLEMGARRGRNIGLDMSLAVNRRIEKLVPSPPQVAVEEWPGSFPSRLDTIDRRNAPNVESENADVGSGCRHLLVRRNQGRNRMRLLLSTVIAASWPVRRNSPK